MTNAALIATLVAVIFGLCGVIIALVASRYLSTENEVRQLRTSIEALTKQISDAAIVAGRAAVVAAEARLKTGGGP